MLPLPGERAGVRVQKGINVYALCYRISIAVWGCKIVSVTPQTPSFRQRPQMFGR